MTERKTVYLGPDSVELSRTCPVCHIKLGRAVEVSLKDNNLHRKMRPGDFTMCAHCCTMLMVQENETLRILTDEEFLKLPDDLQKILKEFSSIRARKSND